MCRLVAYAGPAISPAPLVFGGDHSLWTQSFRPKELLTGSVNADGYGVVWYVDGGPVRVASSFPIWHDEDLECLLASVRAPVAVAALRDITTGIPPSETAIPPLGLDNWAFVLNGYIDDFRSRFMRRIHRMIPDALFARLTGVSDTEALFLLAVAAANQADGPAAANRANGPAAALADLVRDVVKLAREAGADAQLNMVLTDGRRLAACRAAADGTPNSLYVSEGGPMAPDGVILASEPLNADASWVEVPPQTVIDVTEDGTRTFAVAV
jgi:glutamine amidotransferase